MQQGSNGTSMLTDEQILDMELTPRGELVAGGDALTGGAARNQSARNEPAVILSGATDLSGSVGGKADGEILRRPLARTPQNDSERDMALLTDDAAVNGNGDAASVGSENAAASGTSEDATAASGDPARVATGNGDDPAWLKALDAQPQGGREAAAEARAWRAAATGVASLDAAYFSADAGARAGLAARLYDNDPGAFRAMLAESARTLALRDPQGLAELARELGATAQSARPLSAASAPTLLNAIGSQSPPAAARSRAASNDSAVILSVAKDLSSRSGTDGEILRRFAPQNDSLEQGVPGTANLRIGGVDSASERTNRQSGDWRSQETASQQQVAAQSQASTQTANAFPAEAYRSFEAATNDDVARRVHHAIDRTLGTTLPDGMSEGARRRIAEDIFQEVHASLASDRDLARRLGETLRDWRFDAAARQQVSSLLTGRARAVLPEVARRVVAEWTSSVLATDRAKTARIDAASARRDITGGRLPEPVPASSLRPRDLDYRRLSDEQIMEL